MGISTISMAIFRYVKLPEGSSHGKNLDGDGPGNDEHFAIEHGHGMCCVFPFIAGWILPVSYVSHIPRG